MLAKGGTKTYVEDIKNTKIVNILSGNLILKEWKVNQTTMTLNIEDLEPLLSPNTALVCFTHCSNVLGSVMPIKKIAQLVHEKVTLNCLFSEFH